MQLILMRGPFSRTSVVSIKATHIAMFIGALVMAAVVFTTIGLYLAARYGDEIPVIQDVVYERQLSKHHAVADTGVWSPKIISHPSPKGFPAHPYSGSVRQTLNFSGSGAGPDGPASADSQVSDHVLCVAGTKALQMPSHEPGVHPVMRCSWVSCSQRL